MDQEMKAKWIEALRSGRYLQARERLRAGKGFCCLGVLCDLVDPAAWEGERWGDATSVLPMAINNKYNINGDQENVVAKMNDDGSSFAEIADYIEANL